MIKYYNFLLLHGSEGVVRVHQGMHEIVHDHEPTGTRGKLTEAIEDVDKHSKMVIPIENTDDDLVDDKIVTNEEISTVVFSGR